MRNLTPIPRARRGGRSLRDDTLGTNLAAGEGGGEAEGERGEIAVLRLRIFSCARSSPARFMQISALRSYEIIRVSIRDLFSEPPRSGRELGGRRSRAGRFEPAISEINGACLGTRCQGRAVRRFSFPLFVFASYRERRRGRAVEAIRS